MSEYTTKVALNKKTYERLQRLYPEAINDPEMIRAAIGDARRFNERLMLEAVFSGGFDTSSLTDEHTEGISSLASELVGKLDPEDPDLEIEIEEESGGKTDDKDETTD